MIRFDWSSLPALRMDFVFAKAANASKWSIVYIVAKGNFTRCLYKIDRIWEGLRSKKCLKGEIIFFHHCFSLFFSLLMGVIYDSTLLLFPRNVNKGYFFADFWTQLSKIEYQRIRVPRRLLHHLFIILQRFRIYMFYRGTRLRSY